MAINQHHTAEELDGIKCAIAEKQVSPARAAFLKDVLEFNKFTVVVAKSAPAKGATVPDPNAPPAETKPEDEKFTVGVTDLRFNPTNAIFGRLLHTRDGHVVTLAFWEQTMKESHDQIPYYEDV